MPYIVLFCSCVVFFFFFSPLALRLPRLGKRELILVLSVRLFDLRLFRFVCFLFLLVSKKGCGCDCGTPWTFPLTFLKKIFHVFFVSEGNRLDFYFKFLQLVVVKHLPVLHHSAHYIFISFWTIRPNLLAGAS